jgi:hypothetical protein
MLGGIELSYLQENDKKGKENQNRTQTIRAETQSVNNGIF